MATASKPSTQTTTGSTDEIPPLENGDHLPRAEFERRYHAMPHIKKAELIEGVVYMPSPVRVEHHGRPHFDLIALLGQYRWATPGVNGADNTTTRLDTNNEPQPDVCLFIDPAKGGQVRISHDDYLENAPELIAEIASSSASIDTNLKFKVYRRNGVREYLIWRVEDNEIDWYSWNEGEYERLPRDESGLYRSRVFPGLWLDAAALVRGDLPAVQSALNQGLASPEHQAFVARLNRAKPDAEESARSSHA